MQDLAEPLIFVRHGQTDWNAVLRYQGISDTRLSAEGEQQALENAALVQRQLDELGLDKAQITLAASPLSRAQQTAEIIGQELGLTQPLTTIDAFRELSMGRWEGLTSYEVKDRFYEERRSRKSDRWHFKPEGGESMADRCEIIRAGLLELAPNTVLITHCVVLRVIFALLTEASRETAAALETPHVGIWCWNSAKLHRQA